MKQAFLTTLLLSASFCHAAPPVSQEPDGHVNYPSNFQVESGANLFVFGDFLYWIAHEDGLYYAQTGGGSGTADSPPTGSINFNGHLEKIDPKWGSGSRIGIGFNSPTEGYDLILSWTWIANHSSATSQNINSNILALWATPDLPSPLSDTLAEGLWNLDLNAIDLEWGHSSWFGGHFSLRPFFGLRGLWIDQNLNNNYNFNTSPVILGKIHAKSDYRGGGLRVGSDALFAMPYGFSIYGTASGSLLYGQFNAGIETYEDQITIANSKDKFLNGLSSLQLALGLSWDSHFAKDRLHIEFHVGWEQNVWFGANQMNRYIGKLHSGNYLNENGSLTLQGLVAGGRFNF